MSKDTQAPLSEEELRKLEQWRDSSTGWPWSDYGKCYPEFVSLLVKHSRALIAAARLSSGWREISTAPKDTILLTATEFYICISSLGGLSERWTHHWPPVMKHMEDLPTHWLPLPPPPQQDGKEEDA